MIKALEVLTGLNGSPNFIFVIILECWKLSLLKPCSVLDIRDTFKNKYINSTGKLRNLILPQEKKMATGTFTHNS